jgi:hypothetical protein
VQHSIELGYDGKFAENLVGDKLAIEVRNGRWVLTHLPAAPREPEPLRHYFPTEE